MFKAAQGSLSVHSDLLLSCPKKPVLSYHRGMGWLLSLSPQGWKTSSGPPNNQSENAEQLKRWLMMSSDPSCVVQTYYSVDLIVI